MGYLSGTWVYTQFTQLELKKKKVFRRERQRQRLADLCESKASLVYMVKSGTARATE